jgi:phage gp36-like protein
MAYLGLFDYKSLIQKDNLSQVIGGDYAIVSKAEEAALFEIESYLKTKYDTDSEFTDTTQYAYNVVRNAKVRVYLDATAYLATSTYALHDLTLYSGKVYHCKTAITTPESFDITHWDLLGSQYEVFYITLPNNEWNYEKEYIASNVVFWENKNYTAITGNIGEQPDTNPHIWGAGVSYTVSGTTLPTDTAKWTKGDNRNAQLTQYMVDIVLYHIHTRIAPHNIPDIRVKRYDDAITWLKNAAKGDYINVSIQKYQPRKGGRILFGSALAKQNNTY